MEERLKKRLVGTTVLVSLAVIFLPMLVEEPPPETELDRLELALPEQRPAIPSERALTAPIAAPEPLPPLPPSEPDEPLPPVTETAASPPPATPSPAPVPPPRQSEPVVTAAPPAPAPPPPAATGPAAWIIQVASFANQGNAERLVTRLRQAGFAALDADTVTVQGKTLYRVRVGPLADRVDAEVIRGRIERLTELSSAVLRYP